LYAHGNITSIYTLIHERFIGRVIRTFHYLDMLDDYNYSSDYTK